MIKKTCYTISIAALFLIPIFPLIVADSFFFPFITGKAFYFRLLVELAFASWVILTFLDAKYRPKFTPLTIGISIFALVTLLADLLGISPVRSFWSNFERMEGWLVVVHLWMFYMVAVHMFGQGENGKRMWHRWLNMSVVVAMIVSIYGLFQLVGVAATHQGSRVDASLGNAAYMAVYMLIHTGLVAYMFFIAKGKQIANAAFLQWLYPILTIVFGFIVVATATRGTTLGLIGAIILACAIYAVFGKNEPIKWRWISIGVIGLIVLVGVIFWVNRDAGFIQKNEVLRRMASISITNTAGQARQYVWPMAISGALERPILGWGQENFNYIFNANYEPKMWNQEQWFDRAHSVYLDWLVASGFVGLVAYLALYVLLLIVIWKSNLKVSEKSVLTGLLAGYAVHNIFVFDNLASYLLFFALLGFGGALNGGRSREQGGKRMENVVGKKENGGKIAAWLEQKTFSKDAIEYVVMPIVLVALVAGLYFLNIRPIQANTRLIKALSSCGNPNTADVGLFNRALLVSPIANQEIREQILSCAGNVIGNQQIPGPTKQAFFELASKAIQDQITIAPKDARMYVIGGMFLNNVGQTELALPILEKAHELTPEKQSVAIQLAMSYLNTGRNDEALTLLKNAHEADPTHDEAKSAYIMGLVLLKKDAEAHKLFDPSPIFETERIARAYVSIAQYDKAIAIYKKLVASDMKNVGLRIALAQTYYAAKLTWQATETMRAIGVDFPEYKTQVEAAIKGIQK